MADIFISYAREDRPTAQALAAALAAHGLTSWLDRKIPLGRSFDEVIERALADAKCVIVLWSSASVASEWVRNEASEGKRRGILVPVFLESLAAPLAFRMLNGADLTHWQSGASDPELDALIERIRELLGETAVTGPLAMADQPTAVRRRSRRRLWTIVPVAAGLLLVITVWAYDRKTARPVPPPPAEHSMKTETQSATRATPAAPPDNSKDVFAALGRGGGLPASALAKAFYVPDLGVLFAFLSQQQSSLGTLPSGPVVIRVHSNMPAGKAGLQVGDILMSIGGKPITSEDDLRHLVKKLGPGKTQFSVKRGDKISTVTVDCPACTVD